MTSKALVPINHYNRRVGFNFPKWIDYAEWLFMEAIRRESKKLVAMQFKWNGVDYLEYFNKIDEKLHKQFHSPLEPIKPIDMSIGNDMADYMKYCREMLSKFSGIPRADKNIS